MQTPHQTPRSLNASNKTLPHRSPSPRERLLADGTSSKTPTKLQVRLLRSATKKVDPVDAKMAWYSEPAYLSERTNDDQEAAPPELKLPTQARRHTPEAKAPPAPSTPELPPLLPQ